VIGHSFSTETVTPRLDNDDASLAHDVCAD